MTKDTKADDSEQFRRRRVLRTAGILGGGLALGGVGTVAANDKPEKYTTDISGICISAEDSCLDEEVCSVAGSKQYYTVHTSVDNGGGIHVNLHSYRTVTAIGQTSGIEWSGTGTKAFSEQTRGPYPQTVHFKNNLVLTSEDSNALLGIRGLFHVTINANGDVTAYRLDTEFGCLN